MSLIAPFRAIVPTPAHAQAVAAPPYDVLSSAEARLRAAGESMSFLHVSKPEIDLPEGVAADDPAIYAQAAENMARLKAAGAIGLTDRAYLYVYRAEVDGRRQTGIAGAAPVEAYRDGRIRRHELTRPVKVMDRARQIEAVRAHTGPVMLSHRDDPAVAEAVAAVAVGPPALKAEIDGVRHSVWIADGDAGAALVEAARGLDTLYVADGHHRSEAATRVSGTRFLVVSFPESEMRILDYNRVVRDLGGRSPDEFLAALGGAFTVSPSESPVRPDRPGQFALYLDSRWYGLTLKAALAENDDPTAALDAEILSRTVLAPLLTIEDVRNDPRIDFVGGSRGLDGLAARVDSGEMAAAFALYPVSLRQLFAVADAGGVMPPKSTWFEPKLADGLLSLPLDG
ncbi:MAG: DUF1015 family protein [Defluviicoccus sp.]|nr:DUF1015 family protein [Defluviicoccus sp.]